MGILVSYSHMKGLKIIQHTNYKDISIEKIIKNCTVKESQEVLGHLFKEISKETDKSYATRQTVEVVYCTQSNLRFCLNSKKYMSGLFQKFVCPVNQRNFVIEVEWNKQIISFTQKTNKHLLKDKVDLYKKLVSIESDKEDSIEYSNIASKRVLKIINAVCKEIIRRINCIYYYKYYTVILGQDFYQDARSKQKLVEIDEEKNIIHSIKFHLKIDNDFKVNIMHCLNIQFNKIPLKNKIMVSFSNTHPRDPVLNIIQQSVIFKISKDLKENRVPLESKEVIDSNIKEFCHSCEYYFDKRDIFTLSFKLIIDNFDNNKENHHIPLVIEKILKGEIEEDDYHIKQKIVLENYKNNKDNSKFLERVLHLCKDCYLDNTYSFTKKKSVKEIQLQNQRKPLYIDYKSLNLKTNYLSEKEDLEFRAMELLLAAKNPELVQFYKKESENFAINVKNKEIKTFTKLTDMKKAKFKSHKLFQNRMKRSSLKTDPFTFSSSNFKVDDLRSVFQRDNVEPINDCKLKPKTPFFGYSNDLIKYYVDKKEVFENLMKIWKTPNIIRIENISSDIKFHKSRENTESLHIQLTKETNDSAEFGVNTLKMNTTKIENSLVSSENLKLDHKRYTVPNDEREKSTTLRKMLSDKTIEFNYFGSEEAASDTGTNMNENHKNYESFLNRVSKIENFEIKQNNQIENMNLAKNENLMKPIKLKKLEFLTKKQNPMYRFISLIHDLKNYKEKKKL